MVAATKCTVHTAINSSVGTASRSLMLEILISTSIVRTAVDDLFSMYVRKYG